MALLCASIMVCSSKKIEIFSDKNSEIKSFICLIRTDMYCHNALTDVVSHFYEA